jgi:hypothetical protein
VRPSVVPRPAPAPTTLEPDDYFVKARPAPAQSWTPARTAPPVSQPKKLEFKSGWQPDLSGTGILSFLIRLPFMLLMLPFQLVSAYLRLQWMLFKLHMKILGYIVAVGVVLGTVKTLFG